jgi:Ca-activated chloride channel family protein
METALFIDRSSNPGHAVLLMVPPQEYGAIRRLPVDISILIDCSRSMRGKKLFTAKKIAEYLLDNLDQNDSFHVITFSGTSLTESQTVTVGSNRNIRDVIRKIHAAPSTDGEGMLPGIRKSLTMPHDASRYRLLVILTDGYVDDHGEIQRFMNSNIGTTRIFPLIVGATTNTMLFENMARFGRGGILYVNPDDDLPNTVEYFIETLRRPVLRDITVDWHALGGRQSYPGRIPDLHSGRPIVLAACITADRDTSLTISGIAHTGEEAIDIVTTDHSSRAPALGFIWARKHLADLTHRSVLSPTPELTGEIVEIAMQYGILTPYTSFSMVDTRSGRE